MARKQRYENKSVEPARGSNYAFFLKGSQILAGYSEAPRWLSLPSLPADLSMWDQRFLETWKRQTDVYDMARRKSAEDALIAIDIAHERFSEPAVQSLLDRLEAGEQADALLWETQTAAHQPSRPAPEAEDANRFHKHLCQEVAMGAVLAFPTFNKTQICEYLTFGRYNDAGYGLTIDHLSRLRAAFIKRMSGQKHLTRNSGAGFHLEIHSIEMRFRSLRLVLHQASRHQDYRLLRGAELADRIEAVEGLYSCIDRAQRNPTLEAYGRHCMQLWIDQYSGKVLQDIRSQQQQKHAI